MANKTSLTVELDANTRKLDTKLNATDTKLDKLSKTTDKADSSFSKMGKGATNLGSLLLKTTVAAGAVGAAISAMILKSASGERQLQLFAKQAKATTEEFQGLAFATKQYGIDAEKIADISKDVSDKLGEYSAAGTGTFQDYADVMRLTKDEARALAIEFQDLSSEQVIGKMISNMEAANVKGDQMTFVLESMGNDLSRLLPLFSDNSKELDTMRSRFDAINGSMQITAGQAEKLKDVSATFDLMTSSLGNASKAVSATLAPVLDEFFNDIIEVVPDATQAIIDFANSFLAAENITSIAAVNKEIESSLERIAEKEELIKTQRGRTLEVARGHKAEEEGRLAALQAQLEVLKEQETLAAAKRDAGGSIGGSAGGGLGTGTGDSISAIEDRFKTEEQLLTEKLERELLLVGENKELRLSLEQEYLDKLFEMEEAAEHRAMQAKKKKDDLVAKKLGESQSQDKKDKKTKEGYEKAAVRTSLQLAGQLFEGKKEIGAALIVAETAQNVVTSVKNAGGIPVGIPAGLQAASLGVAQLNALKSSSKGGGSISASGASAPPVQAVQPEGLATIDITSGSPTGANSTEIRFAEDSGNDLADAIAAALNKGQQEGRYS